MAVKKPLVALSAVKVLARVMCLVDLFNSSTSMQEGSQQIQIPPPWSVSGIVVEEGRWLDKSLKVRLFETLSTFVSRRIIMEGLNLVSK